MEQRLFKITVTEIDDQLQVVDMVEKKVVATAILAEKNTMLTAMPSGSRISRVNYTSHVNYRNWGQDANTQLVPGCKFKSSWIACQCLSSTSLGGFERSCHGRSRTRPGWSSNYCRTQVKYKCFRIWVRRSMPRVRKKKVCRDEGQRSGVDWEETSTKEKAFVSTRWTPAS